MPQSQAPRLPMAFARPPRTKGGLVIDDHRDLVARLRADAARVAEQFRLPPYDLDADRADASDRYGLCFDDGRIRVRLVHARTSRVLRYSALIDTLVHELAHLHHMDHGPRWELLYEQMLAWCRRQGICAPQPRRSTAAVVSVTPTPREPAQLGLFSVWQ